MVQKLPPIEHNRALVPAGEKRLVARLSDPVLIQLARLRDRIPEPLQASIGTATRRSAKFTGICLGTLSVLSIIAITAFYARLFTGPISMDFVLPAIEKAVNGQLPNASLDIRGAVLRRGGTFGAVEFRLKDVSLLDDKGAPVAQAPFASIGISLAGLLNGRLAAEQINFIEPKLVANYSDERGLALSFSADRQSGHTSTRKSSSLTHEANPAPEAASIQPLPPTIEGAAADVPAAANGQINLVQVLDTLFDSAREGSATSYLTKFGITKATVYYDHGDRLSKWSVPEATVELTHVRKKSVISGSMLIETASKPWKLDFQATQSIRNNRITLSGTLADFTPSALAGDLTAVPALKLFDLPVTVSASAEMLNNGDIDDATLKVDLGSGQIFAPWEKKYPAHIDQGSINIFYDRKDNAILLRDSFLKWGESRLDLAGAARRAPGGDSWSYDISSPNFALASPEIDMPTIQVDTFSARGAFNTRTRAVAIERFLLKAADASISLAGTAGVSQESGGINLTGAISPMPVSFLRLVWPTFVAHGARDWSGKNLLAGRVTGGALKVSMSPDLIAALKQDADVPNEAISFRLDLAGLVMNHLKGMPPIKTGKATASITGRRFVFDAYEDSAIDLPSGEKVNLAGGQFIVADLRPRVPYGEIHFKASGAARGIMELLDQEPLAYMRKGGIKRDLVSGKVSGTFSIGMPMSKELSFKDVSLRGKARHEEVRSAAIEGGLAVNGGTLLFDITEKALEVQGDIRVKGVKIDVAWQKIFDAPSEIQPRIRLRANLDEAAREEFELDVKNVLKGTVPINVAIGLRKEQPPEISVEADLTGADLFLGNVGWRKPPGASASLSFDAVQDASGRVKLENFRVLGDDLSIRGSISLNEKKKPVAFDLPDFSFNILTKMSVSGSLTAQNNWKIDAKGPSFDGRQFFRSLFSAGRVSENQPLVAKNEPGMDIHTEIGTVIGYYDTTVKNVVIDVRKRGGKLVALEVNGRLNGNAPVAARLDARPGQPRFLLAEATDAGAAFRVIGFYPAVRGGEASLKVNLDGQGSAEKSGTLYAQNFVVVGDQVVQQVVSQPGQGRGSARTRREQEPQNTQQQIEFERMTVPFAVGHGQFVLQNSAINGPLIGATMRGRIDFQNDTISLSGTYVPLYGLNAALSPIPIIGDLLSGRQGEGIFGITFGIQGKVSKPDVVVNPMSLVTPGFLRGIMEFDHTPPRVIPREPATAPTASTQRSSSKPPVREQ